MIFKVSLFRCLFFCIAMSFFLSPQVSAEIAVPDAMSQMKATVEQIRNIIKNDQPDKAKSWEEQKVLIRVVVNNRFDFEEMSKRTMAREWKKRTDTEKKHFVKKFSRLLEHTYINRLKDNTEADVLFNKQKVKGNKAVVYTIIQSDQKEIPVIYKMLRKGRQWLVYDVVIEGVSLVRNYRSQFKSIIGKEKYAGLIKRIEEKANDIATSSPDKLKKN